MQHVRIPCRHRWNPMPTHWCTNLLLFLFQSMKGNSKTIPPRILYSACPGQELHKCLDRQCLATTFWNIVKHARMSSAWLFLCMFYCIFVYGRLQLFGPSRSGTLGFLAFPLHRFGEAIASKHYPSLALRMPACLHLRQLDSTCSFPPMSRRLEVWAGPNRKLSKLFPHFFRAPHPNLQDVQANKGKTLFLRRVSSLIFVHVERGKASGSPRRHA